MAWYDYIPVAGSVTRLAQGKGWKAAGNSLGDSLAGPVVGTIGHGEGDAVKSQGTGYENAIKSLNSLQDQQRAFQMQGLDKAEGYYQPAMQELQAIYGAPGQMRK